MVGKRLRTRNDMSRNTSACERTAYRTTLRRANRACAPESRNIAAMLNARLKRSCSFTVSNNTAQTYQ